MGEGLKRAARAAKATRKPAGGFMTHGEHDADDDHKALEALWQTFGYRPDERNGEKWIVYQGHSLIVVHPERRPRIYKRHCGGVFYEILDPA